MRDFDKSKRENRIERTPWPWTGAKNDSGYGVMEKSKLDATINLIADQLMNHRRPIIMWSGGKDSMVMLHLMRFQLNLDIDVLFHREPFLTHKYAFAEGVIRDWGIVAFDYPPLQTGMWQGNGIVAYTNYYQVGMAAEAVPAVFAIPKNIVEETPENHWVCGRDRFIMRPKGGFTYPWDVAFIGHKNSDEDQIAGRLPLHVDYHQTEGGPMLAFPLRHWTDGDVWDYTDKYNLPVNHHRYSQAARRELPDKRYNSDYFHACINCIDRRKSGMVDCPKLGGQIESIAEKVPYNSIKLSYFGEPA